MNKGLIIALALSLAANIFVGGIVTGRILNTPHPPMMDRPPHSGRLMMHPNMAALSPEGREAFRSVFEAHRATLRERHDMLRAHRAAFAEALAAEPWDRTKAEAALAALHGVVGEQQDTFAMLMIDAVETLSAEDRKALAKSFTEERSQRKHRRRKHHRGVFDPPPPPDDSDAY